jgi:hypothetical protein
MPDNNRIPGNWAVGGILSATTMVIPANSVGDDQVEADAGIAASKLEHESHATFAQANTSAADETRIIYVAHAAGEVLEFKAGSIAAAVGDSTVTVDLKKNGTTILSSVITLDNGNTARVVEAGTLVASPTYVAGDVFEVVIDATVGTGTLPTGVFGSMVVNEAAV